MKQFAYALALLMPLAGCTTTGITPDKAANIAPAMPAASTTNYLGGRALPDGLYLVPPSPASGSVAEMRDKEGAAAGLALRGSPRWDLATADADLRPGHVAAAFSCTAGFTIGKVETPALYALVGRVTADLGMASAEIKKRYARPRPFMENGQPSCTPEAEKWLRRDGSYPSGHSAIGYGTGLILAEIMPDRAAQLIARGRAFGDSRRVCNVHWLSDIEEGRIVAGAMVMRLNADTAFATDLALAREEVGKLRAASPAAPADCAKEAQALGK